MSFCWGLLFVLTPRARKNELTNVEEEEFFSFSQYFSQNESILKSLLAHIGLHLAALKNENAFQHVYFYISICAFCGDVVKRCSFSVPWAFFTTTTVNGWFSDLVKLTSSWHVARLTNWLIAVSSRGKSLAFYYIFATTTTTKGECKSLLERRKMTHENKWRGYIKNQQYSMNTRWNLLEIIAPGSFFKAWIFSYERKVCTVWRNMAKRFFMCCLLPLGIKAQQRVRATSWDRWQKEAQQYHFKWAPHVPRRQFTFVEWSCLCVCNTSWDNNCSSLAAFARHSVFCV